jgi:CRISP-associated protein Cas1
VVAATEVIGTELVDDRSWHERAELWSQRFSKSMGDPKRERPRTPLILSGNGILLRIEGGSLTIRNGFTHYPQKQETYRFFKGELAIPDRIIILDGSGSISFGVLSWLAEQSVSLIRIDWQGEVVCAASRSGYAANPYRVQWQRETRAGEFRRMEFSIAKITRKIENSILTLEKAVRRNEAWNKAMEIAYSTLAKLDQRQPKTIAELRSLEANAAAAYFPGHGRVCRSNGVDLADAQFLRLGNKLGQRTSIFNLTGNRNSSHPVNAILNYAYTVLQSEIQIKAISEGYDPTIGIMHEGSAGSAAFVFDLMEPCRPLLDRRILEFVRARVFHSADFIIRSDGVCRLNPEMARCVVALAARN